MSIKKLINNQTIRIDDHRSGCGSIHDWNDMTSDVHLHKKSNSNANGKYDIKIPLNSDMPVTISYKERNGRENQDLPRGIRREITKAFSDTTERESFLNDVYKEFENFNWESNPAEEAQIRGKIESCFGLKCTNVIRADEDSHQLCLMTYDDESGNHFILNHSFNTNSTSLGQFSPGYLRGVHNEAKNEWIKRVFENIEEIILLPTSEERRRYLQTLAYNIRGIGEQSISEAIEYIESLF